MLGGVLQFSKKLRLLSQVKEAFQKDIGLQLPLYFNQRRGANTFHICRLVCFRNPSTECSWNGAWSDKSGEWKKVSERPAVPHEVKEGAFWMSVEDMRK